MADTVQSAVHRKMAREFEGRWSECRARIDELVREQAQEAADRVTCLGHAEGWLPAHWTLTFESPVLTVRYHEPEPEGYWRITCEAGNWDKTNDVEYADKAAAERGMYLHASGCDGAHAVEFVPGRRSSDGQG